MPDIIQLLPDVVANQIAAGEVIQRPASALKELLENAIDAGSNSVKVIIREAGKALIQVVDNGCGMTETDARMSFERYATSKIRKAEDLFSIRTMGFRGEALASIAAIAQVELKTRRKEDEAGFQLLVEGGEFIHNQPVATQPGSSIAVKNLFFNVPARRNFLKSNAAEMRQLVEEFQRVALAHPGIAFSMHHNETEIFNLKQANLRQRISGVFGASYNERLVPVEEDTTLLSIRGFVGKPEFARKSRGEQYFFVNNRYIRDPYLHHAVANAYEELLPAGTYPSYFLFFEIDPARIDVNIHPTKTEIKFEDEKSIYAILRASVKRALGKFNVAPTLNFEQETAFNLPLSKLTEIPVPPKIQVDPSFNPFRPETEIRFPSSGKAFAQPHTGKGQDWSAMYQGLEHVDVTPSAQTRIDIGLQPAEQESGLPEVDGFQLGLRYIITNFRNTLLVIDQQLAHERVLYEKNKAALLQKQVSSQQLVFPQNIEMNPRDFSVLSEMLPELKALGFDINPFGRHTFVVHGTPPGLKMDELKSTLEYLAGMFETDTLPYQEQKEEKIARVYAQRMAIRAGAFLHPAEIKQLIGDLFRCEQPNHSLTGKPVFIPLSLSDLEKKFF